jgi:uracil-DNA glycosylase
MATNFDHGPNAAWEALFATAPIAQFKANPRFRTEFAPVYYRGRLDGSARILVIGQDPAADEILAQRALVGSAGQLVQGLLKKLGITRSYTMLNTFLYGIQGQYDPAMRQVSLSNPFLSFRNSLFDRVKATSALEAVIAFGKGAHESYDNWPAGQSLRVFKLTHPTAKTGVGANWNLHLPDMLAAITPDAGATTDATPYAGNPGAQNRADIPRTDLNFGVPDWFGTNGTRSTRDGTNDKITWSAS